MQRISFSDNRLEITAGTQTMVAVAKTIDGDVPLAETKIGAGATHSFMVEQGIYIDFIANYAVVLRDTATGEERTIEGFEGNWGEQARNLWFFGDHVGGDYAGTAARGRMFFAGDEAAQTGPFVDDQFTLMRVIEDNGTVIEIAPAPAPALLGES
jgi:hypothetical protein